MSFFQAENQVDSQDLWLNFAYGSNLSRLRLAARLPDARFLGTAVLTGFRLAFHKRGSDGSAKCDAFFTGNPEDRIHGVIYALTPAEKQVLDGIEGVGQGYEIQHVSVDHQGLASSAYTYVVAQDYIAPELLPFCWYHRYVLSGALEHGFPEDYVAKIRAVAYQEDPDVDRRQHHDVHFQTKLGSI